MMKNHKIQNTKEINELFEENQSLKFQASLMKSGYFQLKKTANKLQESEEKFKNIFQYSAVGISLVSLNGIFLEVNNALCKITGYSRSELLNEKFKNITYKEDRAQSNKLLMGILSGELKHASFEKRYVHKNGNIIWVYISTALIHDFEGNPLYFVTHTEDITDRKIQDQKLKKMSFIIENTLEGHALMSIGKNSSLIYVNKAWEKITEYKSKDVINKIKPLILQAVEKKPEQKKRLFRAIKLGHVFQEEMEWKTKTGKIITVDSLFMPIVNEGKIVEWFNTIRDITDKKNIEKSVVDVKNRNEAILDSIGEATFACDNNDNIILFNKISEKMTGYSSKNALGVNYKKIFKLIDSKTRKPKYGFIEKLKLKNNIQLMDLNTILIKSDGTEIPILDSASPVIDSENNYLGFIVVFRDITKENQLDQAKNEFISMTSHQLRTPLSATKWVLETLFSDQNPTLKQKEKYEYLNISNERLINLVNKMLSISRIESGKLIINKKNIDLEKLINDLCLTLKTLSQKNNKNIKFINKSNIKNVYCDPILTNEILENLLTNAIEYATEKSTNININIKERKDDYLISVHNDGFIEHSSMEKIKRFGKFVRGTGAQEIEPAGSGLGLYITKKMAEENGGKIWFESNSKDGTTFYVTIIKNKI
jgi:PAS domain S-box-containing protein